MALTEQSKAPVQHASNARRLMRYLPLLLLVVLIVGLWLGGVGRYFDRRTMVAHAVALHNLVHHHPYLAPAGFVAAFAVTAASSLPDLTLMTLASGYLFGPWLGGTVADLGATAGAALIFVAVRSSLGAALREKAERSGGRLKAVLDGVSAGAFGYVLAARMLPASPFWVVSVAASIAGTPFLPYAFGTLLGLAPALFVYGSLGSGLGKLIAKGQMPHLSALLSPEVTVPLGLLGLLSLAVTGFVNRQALIRLFGRRIG